MLVCIIFGPLFFFSPCARLQEVTQRLFVFGGVTGVAISATIYVVLGLLQANNVAAFPLPHAIGHNATSPSRPASHSLSYQNSAIGVGSVSRIFFFSCT